ncbi:MAG: PAS domain-containing sensor histidine kinase [Chitinophagaceae bacterium]|nr:MAG: PAS domain-containing sensor histidine kinase [Chitinophagaceae bacterium]
MEAYLENAPCLYFVVDADGRLAAANATCHQVLGHPPGSLCGREAATIFTLATRIFIQTHLHPLLRLQHSAEEIYLSLRAADGSEVPVLINATHYPGDEQPQFHFAGIVVRRRQQFEAELIAARKAAETALHENTELQAAKQQLQEHVEQIDRQMQLAEWRASELRQINHAVTHEVQEPLRKLSVFSNMLTGQPEREGVEQMVEKIKRVTGQLRDIIQGMQQFVWLSERPLRLREVDLGRLLTLVQQQVEQDLPGTHIALQKENLLPFSADGEQLQLLLYHVLQNAVRFGKPGVPAVVKVSVAPLQRNRFRNVEGHYRYDEFIRIDITDEGTGFDPQYREQVFELFKRLHTQSGRGVGLALCRKIAGNHNGEIAIESRPGVGTTVTLVLPAVAPAAPGNIGFLHDRKANQHDAAKEDIARG